MSLSTMTNDLARPGKDQFPEAFYAENVPDDAVTAKSSAKKAFDALAKFIPTEILAPFIMVLQLTGEGQPLHGKERIIFWVFVMLTPVFLALFEYAKSAEANVAWPDLRQVVWRAIAATFAFAVWSLSVPDNPYQAMVGGVAVAGLLAVLISPILTALDMIVIKLLKPSS